MNEMRHGDFEFNNATQPLIDRISREALQIAAQNGWGGIEVDLETVPSSVPSSGVRLRYTLRRPGHPLDIDEPSMEMIEAGEHLHEVFTGAGSGFRCMEMRFLRDAEGKGSRISKIEVRFRYKDPDLGGS